MDEHMEMMLLMQTDSLPDFSGAAYDDLPFSEDSDDAAALFHDHPHPAFTNQNPHYSGTSSSAAGWEGESNQKRNSNMAAMREMIFRIAAMQPVHIDPEAVKPPKRKNVRISTDPQSVAARHRRERISERIRILQRLVPGGTKMDTASMLDEAIHYVKFLKNQVQSLERVAASRPPEAGVGFPVPMSSGIYFPAAAAAGKGYHQYQNIDA